MPEHVTVPTYAQLLAFAKTHSGATLRTSDRDKPFQVVAEGDQIWFIPSSNTPRKEVAHRTEALLEKLRRTGSFQPGQYQEDTVHASYLLRLVQACQAGRVDEEPAAATRSPLNCMRVELREELWKRVALAMVKRATTRDEDGRVKHGFELFSSTRQKQWVATVYWSDNNLGNDVEVVCDLDRLAQTDNERPHLKAWFSRTASTLQNLPAHNHSKRELAWFRAGFKLDRAFEFFELIRQQLDTSILIDRLRWREEAGPAPLPPAQAARPAPAASAVPASTDPSPDSRFEAALDEMLRHAASACEQSGTESASIKKTKRNLFAGDIAFRQYVRDLIDGQQRRCKITQLPLQFHGEHADSEMLASLDRIDSNGDYAPGNLQVVCRFVNRWKRDDNDANFRRLVALLKL